MIGGRGYHFKEERIKERRRDVVGERIQKGEQSGGGVREERGEQDRGRGEIIGKIIRERT